MCVGTTAAIAIAAGASAAASITAAKMSSNAAKDAAATQSASADKALAVGQNVYQTQQQAQQPYQQLGQQALGRLQGMPPSTAQFNPANYKPGGIPTQQQPQPQMGNLASLGQGPQPMQPMGMQPQAGQMVKLQAPDGSVQQFPSSEAQGIMQRAQAQGHQLRIVQ